MLRLGWSKGFLSSKSKRRHVGPNVFIRYLKGCLFVGCHKFTGTFISIKLHNLLNEISRNSRMQTYVWVGVF